MTGYHYAGHASMAGPGSVEGVSDAELKRRLRSVDLDAFEQFVADLWGRQGWETRVTRRSRDESLDVMAERTEPYTQRHAIRAKRYAADNPVGGPEVAEYSSLTDQFDADVAVVVTTSDFTTDARERAETPGVKPVDGDDLVSIVRRQEAGDLLREHAPLDETTESAAESDDAAELLAGVPDDLTDEDRDRLRRYVGETDERPWRAPATTACPFCGTSIQANRAAVADHWLTTPECTPELPVAELLDRANRPGIGETEVETLRAYLEPLERRPWEQRGSRIECPYCDARIVASRRAPVDHWLDAADCSPDSMPTAREGPDVPSTAGAGDGGGTGERVRAGLGGLATATAGAARRALRGAVLPGLLLVGVALQASVVTGDPGLDSPLRGGLGWVGFVLYPDMRRVDRIRNVRFYDRTPPEDQRRGIPVLAVLAAVAAVPLVGPLITLPVFYGPAKLYAGVRGPLDRLTP